MYTVLVDENSHAQHERERYTHASFERYDEAVAACQQIVDEFLARQYHRGMTADDLYRLYTTFGEDPFIRSDGPSSPEPAGRFSAWGYARLRCDLLCTR